MFIGHYALGFGVKRYVPEVSLGALFLACQWADLLWPLLTLVGIERFEIVPGATAMTPLAFISYPYSHSLLALVVWGVLLALVYKLLVRSARGVALAVLGGLVVSHWILDALVHRPDLPLTPTGTARVGLGLWNAPLWAVTLEVALFALGVWVYATRTVARDRIGRIGLWSLVTFLLVVYAANIMGPPPPSVGAVEFSALALWLLAPLGYWIDAHRAPVAARG